MWRRHRHRRRRRSSEEGEGQGGEQRRRLSVSLSHSLFGAEASVLVVIRIHGGCLAHTMCTVFATQRQQRHECQRMVSELPVRSQRLSLMWLYSPQNLTRKDVFHSHHNSIIISASSALAVRSLPIRRRRGSAMRWLPATGCWGLLMCQPPPQHAQHAHTHRRHTPPCAFVCTMHWPGPCVAGEHGTRREWTAQRPKWGLHYNARLSTRIRRGRRGLRPQTLTSLFGAPSLTGGPGAPSHLITYHRHH